MSTIKCTCGRTAETNAGGNVGLAIQQTGFYPVITLTGKIIWLCKGCAKKAAKLAEELEKILQDEYCIAPALRSSQIDARLK